MTIEGTDVGLAVVPRAILTGVAEAIVAVPEVKDRVYVRSAASPAFFKLYVTMKEPALLFTLAGETSVSCEREAALAKPKNNNAVKMLKMLNVNVFNLILCCNFLITLLFKCFVFLKFIDYA